MRPWGLGASPRAGTPATPSHSGKVGNEENTSVVRPSHLAEGFPRDKGGRSPQFDRCTPRQFLVLLYRSVQVTYKLNISS